MPRISREESWSTQANAASMHNAQRLGAQRTLPWLNKEVARVRAAYDAMPPNGTIKLLGLLKADSGSGLVRKFLGVTTSTSRSFLRERELTREHVGLVLDSLVKAQARMASLAGRPQAAIPDKPSTTISPGSGT